MMPERTRRSPYMEWAKLQSAARYNLATSGVMSYPLAELPVSLGDLEINGTNDYGYRPLLEKLAHKAGVAPECVVEAIGTSLANHLAMAATLDSGDEVLIEDPTYGLLVDVAEYLGARVRRFERRLEDGYRINPDEVQKQVTPQTRLIVITNLHNPSSAFTDEATLRELGDIASRVGARVLVDEVYLEAMFARAPRSSFHLGPQFIATSSLTKGYGLSGLRCGWVLAEPQLADRMLKLNDLFSATAAYPAELLSVIALDNLPRIAARAEKILTANRARLGAALQNVDVFRPEYGTVVFPRLRQGDPEEFFRMLNEQYQTSVVPGRFFGAPQHFRIGLGGETAMTAEGLDRIGRALGSSRR